MITGDGKETAVSIAKSIDIFRDKEGDAALSPHDLDCMEHAEFSIAIDKATVFYRKHNVSVFMLTC